MFWFLKYTAKKNKFGLGIILFVSRLYNIQTLSFTHIKPRIWFLSLYDIVRAHFLAGTESASSYLCAVLPLGARESCRVSMLWQVQYVVFLLHQRTFMKQCVKDARRRRGDTKSIERRQPGAGYETLAWEEPVSEWQVAWPQGFLMKRVCLPAYRSSHISWSEACLTGIPRGALMGTWVHIQWGWKPSAQQVCVCVYWDCNMYV